MITPLLLSLALLTGAELKTKGWQEIARCPGHSWEYLLEKDGQIKHCTGINARGGPKENPCTPFNGKIPQFKKCQNRNSPTSTL